MLAAPLLSRLSTVPSWPGLSCQGLANSSTPDHVFLEQEAPGSLQALCRGTRTTPWLACSLKVQARVFSAWQHSAQTSVSQKAPSARILSQFGDRKKTEEDTGWGCSGTCPCKFPSGTHDSIEGP